MPCWLCCSSPMTYMCPLPIIGNSGSVSKHLPKLTNLWSHVGLSENGDYLQNGCLNRDSEAVNHPNCAYFRHIHMTSYNPAPSPSFSPSFLDAGRRSSALGEHWVVEPFSSYFGAASQKWQVLNKCQKPLIWNCCISQISHVLLDIVWYCWVSSPGHEHSHLAKKSHTLLRI